MELRLMGPNPVAGTFVRGSGLLPTYRHRTVLPVLGHTPQITLALGGLIGRHPRPRELEALAGLDPPRPIALKSRQPNPTPLDGPLVHMPADQEERTLGLRGRGALHEERDARTPGHLDGSARLPDDEPGGWF